MNLENLKAMEADESIDYPTNAFENVVKDVASEIAKVHEMVEGKPNTNMSLFLIVLLAACSPRPVLRPTEPSLLIVRHNDGRLISY